MRKKNLTNKTFGKLTAIRDIGRHRKGGRLWLCRCECGSLTIVMAASLGHGNTKSCGCIHSEGLRQRNKKRATHGMTETPTHKTWGSMLQRCTNPNDHAYPGYGGRGIKVCKRWRKFENFLKDMGLQPEGLTIDRIDNNGDYEPGNCRWATWREQGGNRRTNRWLSYGSEKMILEDWARKLGTSHQAINHHLKQGRTMDDVISNFSQEDGV